MVQQIISNRLLLIIVKLFLCAFLSIYVNAAVANTCDYLNSQWTIASQLNSYVASGDFIDKNERQDLSSQYTKLNPSQGTNAISTPTQPSCPDMPTVLAEYIDNTNSTLLAVPIAAKDLEKAIEQAQRTLNIEATSIHMDSNKRCSTFFKLFGKAFGISRPGEPEWGDTSDANGITRIIKGSPDRWQLVPAPQDDSTLQGFAEKGILVVGVYDAEANDATSKGNQRDTKDRSVTDDKENPGHIAIVVPVAAGTRMTDYISGGPFVIDGDHYVEPERGPLHKGIEVKFRCGISRGNYAFNHKTHAPSWYMWLGGQANTKQSP